MKTSMLSMLSMLVLPSMLCFLGGIPVVSGLEQSSVSQSQSLSEKRKMFELPRVKKGSKGKGEKHQKPMVGTEHANEALRNHKLKFVKPGTKLPHEDFKTLKAEKEALKDGAKVQGAQGGVQEAVLAQSSESGMSNQCLYPSVIDLVFPLRLSEFWLETTPDDMVHENLEVYEDQVWIYTQFYFNASDPYGYTLSTEGDFIDMMILPSWANLYDYYSFDDIVEDLDPFFYFCSLSQYEPPASENELPLAYAQCLQDFFVTTLDVDFLVAEFDDCRAWSMQGIGLSSNPDFGAFAVAGTSNFDTTTTTTPHTTTSQGGEAPPPAPPAPPAPSPPAPPRLSCNYYEHPRLRVGDGNYRFQGTFKDFEAGNYFSLSRVEGTIKILGQFTELGARFPHGRFVSGRLETTETFGVPSISERFLCVSHYSLDFFNCVLETVGVSGRLSVSKFLPDCQAEQLEILITGRTDLLVGQVVGSAWLLNPPPSPPSLLQIDRDNTQSIRSSDASQAVSLGETMSDASGSLEAQEMAEMNFMDLSKKRISSDPPCSQGFPKLLYASYGCNLQTISGFEVFDPFELNLTFTQQFDTNGEMDEHGRFLEATWYLPGNISEVLDEGFCAFEFSGSQIVCTMIYSRLLSRFTLETFEENGENCEEVEKTLTMRAFSGGPFYNVSQGFGDTLTWIPHPEEELTWKATCNLTDVVVARNSIEISSSSTTNGPLIEK